MFQLGLCHPKTTIITSSMVHCKHSSLDLCWIKVNRQKGFSCWVFAFHLPARISYGNSAELLSPGQTFIQRLPRLYSLFCSSSSLASCLVIIYNYSLRSSRPSHEKDETVDEMMRMMEGFAFFKDQISSHYKIPTDNKRSVTN